MNRALVLSLQIELGHASDHQPQALGCSSRYRRAAAKTIPPPSAVACARLPRQISSVVLSPQTALRCSSGQRRAIARINWSNCPCFSKTNVRERKFLKGLRRASAWLSRPRVPLHFPCRVAIALALLGFLTPAGFAAKPPWEKKSPDAWTAADAERILNDSPWAQPAAATFPDPRDREPIPAQALPGAAQAGMSGPRGVTDGRWDGGVGRNNGGGLPELNVLVRWDSAEVVRLAEKRLWELGESSKTSSIAGSDDYVLTVLGLIPANNYQAVGKIESKSSSDNSQVTRASDTERLLENFMSNSALMTRSGASVRPRNVQIDPATGAIRLFFPRSLDIQEKDKEAYFSTRYGSLTVRKCFRLNDLVYKKKLKL